MKIIKPGILHHYLFSILLLSISEENCCNDKLPNAEEDKKHAKEHPDVEVGDVRNSRNILPHLIVRKSQHITI